MGTRPNCGLKLGLREEGWGDSVSGEPLAAIRAQQGAPPDDMGAPNDFVGILGKSRGAQRSPKWAPFYQLIAAGKWPDFV